MPARASTHLVNLGHRRIAMIGGGEESAAFTVPRERRQGYVAALRAGASRWTRTWRPRAATPRPVGSGRWPTCWPCAMPATAVFVQSDEMALGAIRGVRRAGLRVPRDVSIVGFDDHELAEYTDLTTVAQPVRDMGERGGRLVEALAWAARAPTVDIVPTHLVIRGTTAPPAGADDRGSNA